MSKVNDLSDREQEVAVYVANGLTNDEIGELLSIDPVTVKVHLKRIFKKLEIKRRNHLLRFFPPERVYNAVPPKSPEDRLLLDNIAEGLTDSTIANKMGVTVGIVHANVARLRRDTGINTRNELGMWWMIVRGDVKQSTNKIPNDQRRVLARRDSKVKDDSHKMAMA